MNCYATSPAGSRLEANALNGKPFLRQNRKDRYRLGCDLDLAHHFACLIDDAHAGLFY
jgi:hypothetical protein